MKSQKKQTRNIKRELELKRKLSCKQKNTQQNDLSTHQCQLDLKTVKVLTRFKLINRYLWAGEFCKSNYLPYLGNLILTFLSFELFSSYIWRTRLFYEFWECFCRLKSPAALTIIICKPSRLTASKSDFLH